MHPTTRIHHKLLSFCLFSTVTWYWSMMCLFNFLPTLSFIYMYIRQDTQLGDVPVVAMRERLQQCVICREASWPQFYQTRSAWSMDQGSTKKSSAVHNFVPTVTKFCVMWEGLSHMTQNLVTVGSKLLTGEWLSFDPWSMDQADLVW